MAFTKPGKGDGYAPRMLLVVSTSPSPADTWWGLLLSGLLGSVIGGLVTAFAVVLTLRHEDRRGRLANLDTATSRMCAAAQTMLMAVSDKRFSPREYSDMLSTGFEVVARAGRDAEKYENVVLDLLQQVTREASGAAVAGWNPSHRATTRLLELLTALTGAGGRFLRSPSDFERGSIDGDELLRLVREGSL